MPRAALVSLTVALVWGVLGTARAETHGRGAAPRTLSSAERGALHAGQTVSRSVRFTRGADRRYVGGVSYQVVRARPCEVLRALADVRTWPRVLPHTRSAELLSSSGRGARIELVQGNDPFFVTYTLELEQVPGADEIRFWLDPKRPHGVRDLWGFVRVKDFGAGRSLLTLGVAIDLGPGLTRLFFEDRVERTILGAPAKIRDGLRRTKPPRGRCG